MEYLTKKKNYKGFLFQNYNKKLKVFIIYIFCALPKLVPHFESYFLITGLSYNMFYCKINTIYNKFITFVSQAKKN